MNKDICFQLFSNALYVSAGVICNNIVPEWLRVVLLTALLLFVVYKTARKGKR